MPFNELLADAAIIQAETQARLTDFLGEGATYDGDWNLDLQAGVFSMASTSGVPPFVCRAELLGSASPEAGTWLWAWANSSFSPEMIERSSLIREFGERYDIPELRDAAVDLDGVDPRQFAWWMGAVAALVLGQLPTYTFPAGGGTIGAVLLIDDRLQLPAPSVPRLLRSAGEATESVLVARRSVQTWASVRGVPLEETPDGLRVVLSDGHAEFSFDGQNRLINISGHAGPSA